MTTSALPRVPKGWVPGEGPLGGAMIVGEAPGAQEDEEKRPFVGLSGQKLRAALEVAGFDPERAYITNVYKTRPPKNRTPTAEEIASHLPYLKKEIQAVQPIRILALGNVAFQALTGSTLGVTLYRGFWTKLHRDTFHYPEDEEEPPTLVLPTFHPAALLYNAKLTPTWEKDLKEFADACG